jgi:hypothetical protein
MNERRDYLPIECLCGWRDEIGRRLRLLGRNGRGEEEGEDRRSILFSLQKMLLHLFGSAPIFAWHECVFKLQTHYIANTLLLTDISMRIVPPPELK